ncbi:MAG: peptide chain release factor N(5)-glutamine methyltransferase [Holosporales bacterium]|jgi:release factor glutamine methyltransferase|nr:peptide chain release factor N(5)-glutamine methyltransferase [Holosporales bacterium]
MLIENPRVLTQKEISDISINFKISKHDFLLLLSNVLNISSSEAFLTKAFSLSEKEYATILNYTRRRGKREPIAKIINKKEFYGIDFKTSKETLDPRPETELVIDLFKKYFPDKNKSMRILDLGAGTGCLGLTILKLYPNITADFADISEKALNIAKYNAINLRLIDRCRMIKSDWFSNIKNRYDAILSNPPYVSVRYKLDKETLYDPEIALFAGVDGIDAYKKILPKIVSFLNPDSLIFIEIGYDQKEKILEINKNLFPVEIKKDLAGVGRVIVFSNSSIALL